MGFEMNKSMDLITELCVYFECEASKIQDRLQNGTLRLAEEWKKMDPKTPEETLAFYQEAENYVFDLAQWHLSEWTKRQTQNILEFCRQKGLRRILDYGCGIGEEGIALAKSGFDVTLADVLGNTFNFAKWRVQQKGLQVKFINVVNDAPLQETYDGIICLEVLEHLWELEVTVKHLHQHFASEGFLLVTATFYHSDLHPMHLKKNLKYQGEEFLQMMRNIRFESFGRGYQPMIFQKRQNQ